MAKMLMKVDAFRVIKFKNNKLEDVLEKMHSDKKGNKPLSDRVRVIDRVPIRFEDIEKRKKGDGSYYWVIDFINLSRNHGPGKASKDTELEPFEFDPDIDEQFSYDSAMFYDEISEYAVIQYNHQGPKSGAIAKYLARYCSHQAYDFGLNPVLREDIEDVLQEKTLVKKVMVGIDTREYQNNNESVNEALEKLDGGDHVYIEVSVRGERERSLGEKITNLANSLRKDIDNIDGLTQLKMGVSDGNSQQEILDFLNAKLSSYVSVSMGKGYRVSRDDRWKALQRTYDEWVRSGALK